MDLKLCSLSGTQAWLTSVLYGTLTFWMNSWVDFLEGAMLVGTWGYAEWSLDGYLFLDAGGGACTAFTLSCNKTFS